MTNNQYEIARFWSRVDVREARQCWVWKAALHSSGYGAYSFARGSHHTHRYAYELTYGDIPEGMFVCHHCDNKPCCNPHHLFLGTHQANMSDKKIKMRQTHGPQVNTAKLTEEQVIAIRETYATGTVSPPQLALLYGVSSANIYCIVRRKTWDWL